MAEEAQEDLIGELKSCVHFDYIACRRQISNKHIMATSVLAHNLARELQMQATKKDRGLGPKLRQQFLFRAGKITRPGGKLTLTMSDNRVVQKEMNKYLDALAA